MSLSTASSGPSGSPCWFVGAMVDGRDQTERFLSDGLWEHGFDDDRIAAQVLSMRMGERIAIKAAYIRKRDLPFDNGGHTVSVMAITVMTLLPLMEGFARDIDAEKECRPATVGGDSALAAFFSAVYLGFSYPCIASGVIHSL